MNGMPLPHRLRANDADWCVRANALCASDAVRRYFSAISKLGDGPLWYALIFAPVALRGVDGLIATLHLAAIGLLAVTVYKTLKRWTRRPRPCASDVRIRAWVAPLDEFSFPSGHTLHAVAFGIVAIGYAPMAAWLLVPFVLSIAASRVVLGLHYPSDVLAATGIGSALAFGSFWLRDAILIAR